jgi:hypothetical protein
MTLSRAHADVAGLRTDSTLETDIHVKANVQKAARNPERQIYDVQLTVVMEAC